MQGCDGGVGVSFPSCRPAGACQPVGTDGNWKEFLSVTSKGVRKLREALSWALGRPVHGRGMNFRKKRNLYINNLSQKISLKMYGHLRYMEGVGVDGQAQMYIKEGKEVVEKD